MVINNFVLGQTRSSREVIPTGWPDVFSGAGISPATVGLVGSWDIENQDAGVGMWTRIQTKMRVSSAGIAEAATARAIGAVADVDKVLENCRRGIHSSVEQRILADQLEIGRHLCCCWLARTSRKNPTASTTLDFITPPSHHH
jgi:hypothetical protein